MPTSYDIRPRYARDIQQPQGRSLAFRDFWDTTRIAGTTILGLTTFNADEIIQAINTGDWRTVLNSVLASLAVGIFTWVLVHQKNARKMEENISNT